MLVQIVERCPAKLTKLSVDASGCGFQLVADILIGLHIAAGGRRDLGITDFAVVLRVLLEQRLVGENRSGNPFE